MKLMVSRWVFFQAKNAPNRPRYQGETLKHHKSWGVFLSIRVSDALPTQAVPRYGPIPVKRQKCRGFWFWEAETTFLSAWKNRGYGTSSQEGRWYKMKLSFVPQENSEGFWSASLPNRQKNCWGDFFVVAIAQAATRNTWNENQWANLENSTTTTTTTLSYFHINGVVSQP